MRLIDADALRERMYHDAFETDSDMQKWDSGCWIRYKMFENAIKDAPTIEGRKTGEWTVKEGELALWDVCGICRKKIIHRTPHYNFCPNCGADMRGDK